MSRNEESQVLTCDACETTMTHALRCPYCQCADVAWCSAECRAGLGWSMHENECNVIHSDALPCTPYAWQNTVENVARTWDSQEKPFPAFLVRSSMDKQLNVTQTVLPAVVAPQSQREKEDVARIAQHKFSVTLDNGTTQDPQQLSRQPLNAPDHMISGQSTQTSAHAIAGTRTERPRGHSYWVSERVLRTKNGKTSLTLTPNTVNTFSITRNTGAPRAVSFYFDSDAVPTFQDQLYSRLGYGLKQFLAQQYKLKGLGSDSVSVKRSLSTHHAINPETGDAVVFSISGDSHELVDLEFYCTKQPAPVRLQQQTFSLTPQENDPVDIQALCMAIEDRLDELHNEPDQEARTMVAQYETQFDVLHRHLERLTTVDTNIGEDVQRILEVRNAINMTQELLFEPISAESTQDLVDRWRVTKVKQIKEEVDHAIRNVKKRRKERDNSAAKARSARWTKPFASLKRIWRSKGTKRAENELQKVINALKVIEIDVDRSQAERNEIVKIRIAAELFFDKSKKEKKVTDATNDGRPPAVPPQDADDLTNAEIHMAMPERQRVIPLITAAPVGGYFRKKTGDKATDDDVVEWKDTIRDKEEEQAALYEVGKNTTVRELEAYKKGFRNYIYNEQKDKKFKQGNRFPAYTHDELFVGTDPQPSQSNNQTDWLNSQVKFNETVKKWKSVLTQYEKGEIQFDELQDYIDDYMLELRGNEFLTEFEYIVQTDMQNIKKARENVPLREPERKPENQPEVGNDQVKYDEAVNRWSNLVKAFYTKEIEQEELLKFGIQLIDKLSGNRYQKDFRLMLEKEVDNMFGSRQTSTERKPENQPKTDNDEIEYTDAVNRWTQAVDGYYADTMALGSLRRYGDRLINSLTGNRFQSTFRNMYNEKIRQILGESRQEFDVDPKQTSQSATTDMSRTERAKALLFGLAGIVADPFQAAWEATVAAGEKTGDISRYLYSFVTKTKQRAENLPEDKREGFVEAELKKLRYQFQTNTLPRDDGGLNYPNPSGFVPARDPGDAAGERNYYYGGDSDDDDYYHGQDDERMSWERRTAPQTMRPDGPAGKRNYYYGDDDYTW